MSYSTPLDHDSVVLGIEVSNHQGETGYDTVPPLVQAKTALPTRTAPPYRATRRASEMDKI